MDSSYDGVAGDDRPIPTPGREYRAWHLHDAGGPALRLKTRSFGDGELPGWRDGPDLDEALALAAAEAGWEAYDREPGEAPGEYAIIHLVREAPAP